MSTFAWSCLVFVCFLLLLKFRPVAVIAAFFILFGLISRVAGLVYIQLHGPVYAEELDAFIKSSPGALQFFCMSVLVFMAALAIVFRPSIIHKAISLPQPLSDSGIRLSNIVFLFALLFLALLYADMLRRGVIPLFENMERYDYTNQYAGPLHKELFEHGFLYVAILGMFFTYPRLIERKYDYRFIGLLIALFGYCVLTGHRFSAFFSFGSFFILPFASVYLLKGVSALPELEHGSSLMQKILQSRFTWYLGGVVLVLAISIVMYHSLTMVRNYEDPIAKLVQRILVQPVQMWLVTWNNIIGKGEWLPSSAWDLMFSTPLEPERNTGIQYLMARAIGIDRTTELLSIGNQYAGGYPETLFELVGPYMALPIAFFFSMITALILRLIMVGVCRGNFGTALMGIYVFYGFSLLFIGGMLNFLTAPTFIAKVFIFIVIYQIEMTYYQHGRRLFPWIISSFSNGR